MTTTIQQTEIQTDSSLACRYVDVQKLIDAGFEQVMLSYIVMGGSAAHVMSFALKDASGNAHLSDENHLQLSKDLALFSDALHKASFSKESDGMGRLRWEFDLNVICAAFQSNQQAEVKESEKRQPVLWFSVGIPDRLDAVENELIRESHEQ